MSYSVHVTTNYVRKAIEKHRTSSDLSLSPVLYSQARLATVFKIYFPNIPTFTAASASLPETNYTRKQHNGRMYNVCVDVKTVAFISKHQRF